MAKKTKVVKAKVRRRKLRKTKPYCEYQVWYYSKGGMVVWECGIETLKEANESAEDEDLIAPVIIKIDIPPMEY